MHIQIPGGKLLGGVVQLQNRFGQFCGALSDAERYEQDADCEDYKKCNDHHDQHGIVFRQGHVAEYDVAGLTDR